VAIAVLSTCKIFSTAHRRELVVVFKVSYSPFLNCFASFLLDIIFLPALPSRTVYPLLFHFDFREKISSAIQDLFSLRKPLTYPGSARVQGGLQGRCIRFRKHSPALPKRVSVIGLYCYHVNRIHALVMCSHFEQL